jgi:hypothetical protein
LQAKELLEGASQEHAIAFAALGKTVTHIAIDSHILATLGAKDMDLAIAALCEQVLLL